MELKIFRRFVFFVACLSLCSCAIVCNTKKIKTAESLSPLSINITDNGLLQIKDKVDEPIEIKTHLESNLRPGFIAHRAAVSKGRPYQTLFLNVTEAKFVPVLKDYKGRASLEVSYVYDDRYYQEHIEWKISIPKGSLGEVKTIYEKDGTASSWRDISGFSAMKISHQIQKSKI